jgi:methyl-galactoside transport system ATP-binding protein
VSCIGGTRRNLKSRRYHKEISMAEYYLEMKGISKSFPGVKALDNVSLSVRPGTVHALMGENGAGKSTLMKCLFGIYKMDAGEILINGQKVTINNPDEAMKMGIAMVHQELQPVLPRSVAENMYLGRFPYRSYGPLKVIDHKKMYQDAAYWLKEVGMDFDPKTPLSELSIGQMQTIEIAKAVSHEAKVIIFDEPTSSLSDKEVEVLFHIMNDLRNKGVAMIYISHKMDEIKRISDDITIMRDGTYVGTWPAAEMTTDQIIAKMVGRELTNVYPDHKSTPGETVIEVKGLSSIHDKSFQDCSFNVRKGEIVGFGGLVGAQRTELMEAIFGMRGIKSGEIYMNGKKIDAKTPRKAMNSGIGLITEDRRGHGILGCLSIKDNTGVSIYDKNLKAGFILDHPEINKIVDESIKKLSIKTPNAREAIANLSGGNQQKVIIARWLANDPDLLIMDEPTRGIDIGAKHEIYEIMVELQKQGKAIIMISSEMAELLGMSDRIYVMCNGHIRGEIKDPAEMTQEKVMSYATMF